MDPNHCEGVLVAIFFESLSTGYMGFFRRRPDPHESKRSGGIVAAANRQAVIIQVGRDHREYFFDRRSTAKPGMSVTVFDDFM